MEGRVLGPREREGKTKQRGSKEARDSRSDSLGAVQARNLA